LIFCNTSGDWAYCMARMADNTSGACYTGDLRWIQAAASVGPASYLRFYWDENGYCTWVNVSNQSAYL
jgi:hypothetical protein